MVVRLTFRISRGGQYRTRRRRLHAAVSQRVVAQVSAAIPSPVADLQCALRVSKFAALARRVDRAHARLLRSLRTFNQGFIIATSRRVHACWHAR
jgi:hypothetical protein